MPSAKRRAEQRTRYRGGPYSEDDNAPDSARNSHFNSLHENNENDENQEDSDGHENEYGEADVKRKGKAKASDDSDGDGDSGDSGDSDDDEASDISDNGEGSHSKSLPHDVDEFSRESSPRGPPHDDYSPKAYPRTEGSRTPMTMLHDSNNDSPPSPHEDSVSAPPLHNLSVSQSPSWHCKPEDIMSKILANQIELTVRLEAESKTRAAEKKELWVGHSSKEKKRRKWMTSEAHG